MALLRAVVCALETEELFLNVLFTPASDLAGLASLG